MKRCTTLAVAAAATALGIAALTGCTPQYPDIAGVWNSSDGTPSKTISDDGNCTNLLYTTAKAVSKTGRPTMYVSDNPGMCHVLRTAAGGAFVFQVHQSPYTRNYVARFSHGNTVIALSYHGDRFTTLTKVAGSH